MQSSDIVLLHTGWLAAAGGDPARAILRTWGGGAIDADNHPVEVFPAESKDERLPVHGYLLIDQGIHLLAPIHPVAIR